MISQQRATSSGITGRKVLVRGLPALWSPVARREPKSRTSQHNNGSSDGTPCAAICMAALDTQVPTELLRRALGAAVDLHSTSLHHSTSIIQSAPNGATWFFTTLCALSVALGALTFNLFSILAQLQGMQKRSEEKRHILFGVDVTNSRYFRDERVLSAVEFAAEAHAGQVRKTGEPYVSHCLETALIVEHNLPPAAAEYDRYMLAIVAAVLHDVIDDTSVDISAIRARFGSQVSNMVEKVSKLSNMNQLLRRGKRKGWAEYGPQHFKALRKMIVDMVFEEPLVILIKLADRLHNMRTVFVLKPEKQIAVAEETLEVWCTMAECLGWDALKSEMEDLCFAVLRPTEYCTIRAQLDRLWSLPSLKVVVDQFDSNSLPENALAPAPPLTARGRRAAAANAARRAAREAYEAGVTTSAASVTRSLDSDNENASAAFPHIPVASMLQNLLQSVRPPDGFPALKGFSSKQQQQQYSKGHQGANPMEQSPVPNIDLTVGAQEFQYVPDAQRPANNQQLPLQPALPAVDVELNLGIRIVSSCDGSSVQSPSGAYCETQWDLVSWSVADQDLHPGSTGSAVQRQEMHPGHDGYRNISTADTGVVAAGVAEPAVSVTPLPMTTSGADVREYTAATVERFCASDPDMLKSSTVTTTMKLSQSELPGNRFDASISMLSDRDRQTLQDQLNAVQALAREHDDDGVAGHGSQDGDQLVYSSNSSKEPTTLVDWDVLRRAKVLRPSNATSSPSSRESAPESSSTGLGSSASSDDLVQEFATRLSSMEPSMAVASSGSGSSSRSTSTRVCVAERTATTTLAPAVTGTSTSTATAIATAMIVTTEDPQVILNDAPQTSRLERATPIVSLPSSNNPDALLTADELQEILMATTSTLRLKSPSPAAAAAADVADEPAVSGAGEVRPLPPVLFTEAQLGNMPVSTGTMATASFATIMSMDEAPAAAAAAMPATAGGSSKGGLSEQQEKLRSLLSTVVPFDSVNFKDPRSLSMSTQRGLEVLDQCAELLYSEVQLRSSMAGLGLLIQGRLKSLYSVYKKMVRKNCSVAQVYDARALRVIVGDDGGSRTRDAIDACYKLVSIVHSIWKPIPGEFDDYIANPKPSGYQALHTAVRGPGGVPMEVQIKTMSMHELAEYGAAAHWVYKEYSNSSIPLPISPVSTQPNPSLRTWLPTRTVTKTMMDTMLGNAPPAQQSHMCMALPDMPPPALPVRLKGRGWEGQPVLRIAKDKLRHGVVVGSESEGRRLLVAVRSGPTSEQYPVRVPDYGFYYSIIEYVRNKGWTVPGHSDLNIRLEEYVLSNDGRFHRRDHMGYVQPGEVLTLLEGFEEDADAIARAEHAAAYAAAHAALAAAACPAETAESAAAACAAQQLQMSVTEHIQHSECEQHAASPHQSATAHQHSNKKKEKDHQDKASSVASDTPTHPAEERFRRQMQEAYLRTQQLRTMIEWGRSAMGKYHQGGAEPGEEVSILVWPGGTIEHWPRGTTVGQVVRAKGILSLSPSPDLPDIRPSATAVAGGDDGWISLYNQASSSSSQALDMVGQDVVNVNNRLVAEDTTLNDGDLVILAREKVKI